MLSSIHQRALNSLSAYEWRSYSTLQENAPFNAFDDLWQMGLIEARIERLRDGPICHGTRHFYKLPRGTPDRLTGEFPSR